MTLGVPIIDLSLQGDGAWRDLEGREADTIHAGSRFALAALEEGMVSGKPALALRIDLPDGKVVIVETSLVAWQAASQALEAKFGRVVVTVARCEAYKGFSDSERRMVMDAISDSEREGFYHGLEAAAHYLKSFAPPIYHVRTVSAEILSLPFEERR